MASGSGGGSLTSCLLGPVDLWASNQNTIISIGKEKASARQWPLCSGINVLHDDVIKWKHFPRYWPFVRGIHRSPVNSMHKGQWRGDLMFSLICARLNGRVNNGEAGDLRRHRAHYDVIVMRHQVFLRDTACNYVSRRTTWCLMYLLCLFVGYQTALQWRSVVVSRGDVPLRTPENIRPMPCICYIFVYNKNA